MENLRLDSDGLRVLDEWRNRCKSHEDACRVADVLADVAGRRWQQRWPHYTDDTQPDITSIVPRGGLHVHLRLWTGGADQFTIVSISDVPPEEEED